MGTGNGWLILFLITLLLGMEQRSKAQIKLMFERKDTSYIADYRRNLNLRVNTVFEKSVIAVFDEAASSRAILYQSNPPIPKYGLSLSYRWANFEFFGPLPGLSYSDPNKGTTINRGIAFGITLPKLWFRTSFEDYQGFYQSKGSSLFPDGKKPRIREDARSFTYFASLLYGFNGDRYSHRSTLWQSEGQRISSGSFMIGMNFTYQGVRADSSLTELDPQDPSRFLAEPEIVNNTSFGLSAGYAYTWAINRNWYITGMLVPGLSYVWKSQITENEEEVKSQDIGGFTEIRMVGGYHSPTWFYGAGFTSYGLGEREEDNNTMGINTLNYARLFLGYRFPIKPIRFLRFIDLSN